MLKIHNSLTGEKEEFKPLRANEVRMYVCGMTNYDYIHVGHARMLTVFDLIQRYLRSLGYEVTYVRNVTDIDDKIIERAAANGENWADLGAALHRGHARGLRDSRAASRRTSSRAPPSTSRPIIAMTQTLIDKGYAYVAGNGDVMYSVRKFPKYGRLSGKKIDDLRAGSRVQVDDVKLDPLGFRALEARQAGRAVLGLAVGRRPSRLAHRMLGHVDEPARQLFRHARRRRGFEVSAP